MMVERTRANESRPDTSIVSHEVIRCFDEVLLPRADTQTNQCEVAPYHRHAIIISTTAMPLFENSGVAG